MAKSPRRTWPPPDGDKSAWGAIAVDYAANELSIRKIGRKHGVSDAAIRQHAKKAGWPPRGFAEQLREVVEDASQVLRGDKPVRSRERRAWADSDATPEEPEKRSGQPAKLMMDAATLRTIEGAGQIQCTLIEVAALLGSSEEPLRQFFKQWPEAADAYEKGKQNGKSSLRRQQFKLAMSNPAMAIFLGKNYLGQADRHEVGGSGGGAIPVRLESLTSAQLAAFAGRLDAEIAQSESGSDPAGEKPEKG